MHRDLFSAFLARYVDEDQLSRDALAGIRDGIHPARGMAVLSTICESSAFAERRSAHPPVEQISSDPKQLTR